LGKFERLSWDELREHITAIAGGTAYHSLSADEVAQLIAEALARIMERIESPKPGRQTPKRRKKQAGPL
jgi:hypothetical protein